LAEIMRLAAERGLLMPEIRTAVRTGDTLALERQRMLRRPPHILVTTPESLYILLTAERSRKILRDVETVIVDEIHAVAGDKRGTHLLLSLERLEAVTAKPPVRIGLSATQKPLDEIARFLTGADREPPAVVDVGARLGTDDPYVWLDPELMGRAVAVIVAALAAANPPAAGMYRKNGEGFAAEMKSTAIDYQSTLSTCPRRTIATADGAFAAMARQYGLEDLIVGAAEEPAPADVASATGRVEAAGLTTVFAEPFVATGTVQAVAAAAHARVRNLDPLSGPPAGGWPHHPDYVQLLEQNLGTLSAALGCPNTETGM